MYETITINSMYRIHSLRSIVILFWQARKVWYNQGYN